MTKREWAEVLGVGAVGLATGVGAGVLIWRALQSPTSLPASTLPSSVSSPSRVPSATVGTGTQPPAVTAPAYTYTVQEGDTLSAIAACDGTTAEVLAQMNHISDPDLIYPGTVLKLPNPLNPHCRIQPVCDPMSMACLLDYAVGKIPVANPEAWVPAQQAARTVYASGYDIFTLTHHPVGYFGPALIPAQHAADYLLQIGIDPCPANIYQALQVASAVSGGVPLPLLLSVAYTESRFLQYGHVANSALVNAATGATGLMQMRPIAVAQVQQSFPSEANAYGLNWSTVQANYQANAIAAALYLRYLATQAGLPYTATNYAAWLPILKKRYGEGGAATVTVAHAASASWVQSNTPYAAQVKQYTAGLRRTAPQVTCTVHRMAGPNGVVTIQTCTNGTARVVAGAGVS